MRNDGERYASIYYPLFPWSSSEMQRCIQKQASCLWRAKKETTNPLSHLWDSFKKKHEKKEFSFKPPNLHRKIIVIILSQKWSLESKTTRETLQFRDAEQRHHSERLTGNRRRSGEPEGWDVKVKLQSGAKESTSKTWVCVDDGDRRKKVMKMRKRPQLFFNSPHLI